MTHEPSKVEDRLDRLADLVRELEARLSILEEQVIDGAVSRTPAAVAPGPSAPAMADVDAAGRSRHRTGPALRGLTLVGRTLLALAGAFLLRALTEAQVLSEGLGVGLGMAYALVWLALADYEGRHDRRRSATFHGITGAVVGFPLIWEVVSRFRYLSPGAGAVFLGIFSVLGLVVAWRRRLRGMAWIMVLGATAAGVALAAGTNHVIPFGFGALVLGLAVLWVGYDLDWHGLSWPYTWLIDVVMFFLVALYFFGGAAPSGAVPGAVPLMVLLLVFLLGYLGSVGARTLLLRRSVTTFEVLQTLGVLLFGLGGAVAVHSRSGEGLALLGPVSVVLAASFYFLAFMFLDRRTGQRANFLTYTSVALVFTLVSGAILLPSGALAIFFAAGAVLMAWMGGVFSRVTLSVHCAAYSVAAALTSGLVLATAGALFGGRTELDRWLTPTMLVVLAAVLICAWFRAPTHERVWGRLARLPKVMLLAVGLWGLFGLVIALVSGAVPHGAEGAADRGALAVARTGILAVSALGLARAGRMGRFREAAWLVYPVLFLGGFKLLIQDLPQGRPLTLFLSLALFGGALILAPRFSRREV